MPTGVAVAKAVKGHRPQSCFREQTRDVYCLGIPTGIVVISGVTDNGRNCWPPGTSLQQALYYNPTTAQWYQVRFPIAGASMVSGVIGNQLYFIDRFNNLRRVSMTVSGI